MKSIPFKKDIVIKLAAMGALAGFLNGLLGAGGGIIIVLAINKYLKTVADDKNGAFATALCIMLPISLLSFILYSTNGHVSTEGFGLFIPSAILGGVIGGLILERIKPTSMKKFFAVLIAVSGVLLILR